ncbi:MAG: hypothetical protein EA401_05400 [Planctomycetota bacterium]|nr:MAG: hypothetical protein EA401_05400 [Planctomycetota bacterium]
MSRYLPALLLLGCLSGWAAANEQARTAVVAEIALLQAQLQEQRQEIEAARRERLRTLQDTVHELRTAQEERKKAQTAQQEAAAVLQEARAQQHQGNRELRQLRALFQQHGLVSGDNNQHIVDDAALRQELQERLDLLTHHARPRRSDITVYNRSGHSATLPVLEWGMAQRVALGSRAQDRGFLTRDDAGAWLIQGPTIPQQTAAAGAWLDISGRLASEPPRPRGIRGFIERGGPFVWPIFAIAVVAILAALTRVGLRLSWRRPQGAAAKLLRAPDVAEALAQARRWRGPIGSIFVGILTSAPDQRQEIAGAVLAEAEVHLSRGLRLLAVLAAAAPLLGLLGTVTGMIASFEALGAQAGADAERLSAGIGQALLTTELGLIVAVPTLIVHALFARDASRWRSRCEAEALRLLSALDTLHTPSSTPPPPGPGQKQP